MTVGELVQVLLGMPQDVSVVISDAQFGDELVTKAEDTTTYTDGVRVVRISWS